MVAAVIQVSSTVSFGETPHCIVLHLYIEYTVMLLASINHWV